MIHIGCLGGTFDPIHCAHLALASCAQQAYALDKILFIPCQQAPYPSPDKPPPTNPSHRLAMLHLACDKQPGWEIDTLELDRDIPSYTINTLCTLSQRHPEAKWHWILGQDAFSSLPSWKNWWKLFQKAHLIVAQRAQALPPPDILLPFKQPSTPHPAPGWSWLEGMQSATASRILRQQANLGTLGSEELPNNVLRYILKNQLYQDRSCKS